MPDDDPIIVEGLAASPAGRMRLGQPRLVSDNQGRIPAFRPTDEQRHTVQVLAANNITQAVIASLLKIHVRTLSKYFSKELAGGWEQTNARVGYALVKEALKGNVGAQKYWLQTHGGKEWRIPKEAEAPDRDDERADEPSVKFYIPANGRDAPEPVEEPPIIDAEAEIEPDESVA